MEPHSSEGLQAVFDSTRWNVWFVFAYALPFILLIPTAFIHRRWIGGPIVPVAMLGSWILYCMGVGVIHRELDDYEQRTGYLYTADTGLALSPFIWGIPIAVTSSLIAGCISFVIHLFLASARETFANGDQKDNERPIRLPT